jgi:hypothetical protein
VKFLEDIILAIVFFEHLCFAILGVTGTEGQEIERFLGARKLARLLVGQGGFHCFTLGKREKNAWKRLGLHCN